MAEFIGMSASDAVRSGALYRATWGKSTLADARDFIALGWNQENELEKWAAEVGGKIPTIGIGYKSAGPTVNGASDAFTVDIRTMPNLSSRPTAKQVADMLDNLGGVYLDFTRLELVSSTETASQAEQARQRATAGSEDMVGASLLADKAGDLTKDYFGALKKYLLILAIVVVVIVALMAYSGKLPSAARLARKAVA